MTVGADGRYTGETSVIALENLFVINEKVCHKGEMVIRNVIFCSVEAVSLHRMSFMDLVM